MTNKFITKKIVKIHRTPIESGIFEAVEEAMVMEKAAPKNKKNKSSEAMTEIKDMAALEQSAQALSGNVKVVKKDRGLIERTESSKIILTEDNRQVLND